MSRRKHHRRDRLFYQDKVIVKTAAIQANHIIRKESEKPTYLFYSGVAGEDLSSSVGQFVTLKTDGKLYLTKPALDNWNRVAGVLITGADTDEDVTYQPYGYYSDSNYDFSSDNPGDGIYIRNSGMVTTPLTNKVGSEVLHIHAANIINDNTIELIEPNYLYFL